MTRVEIKQVESNMTGKTIKQGMLVQRLEINFSEETKEFLLEALKAEPVKHGEWEECKNGWRCTACGKRSERLSDFCSNCGARMEVNNG